ncbi:MAG TPA: ABC transporter substrate binding protein, partial [Albitalea sp.]|nr:ABC transporter substrate binding protein [Albitalea sp.]
PGGQLTGLLNYSDDLMPKRLELLKAAVPGAQRIALARCPRCQLTTGSSQADVDTMFAERDAAARAMGVKLLQIDVDDAADFDAATAALRREHPDALLIGTNQINVALREKWIAFAVAQRLPLAADYRDFGAMLSYGPDYAAIYRKAAEFVVRILQGARPGDLAMEQPTKFELVINLKAARAIGITIPQSVLLRADEVIE